LPEVSATAPERALHVPEELALEQLARKARAVDRDEGRLAARASLVYRARKHALPGPARAEDKDVCLGLRGPERDLERSLHRRLGRFEIDRREPVHDLVLERLDAALEGKGLGDLREDGPDLVGRKRLRDEVERAATHRLDGGGDVGVGGEDDDGRRGPQLHQPCEDVQPVVGPQLEVQEDCVESFGLGGLDRLGGGGSLGRDVAGRLHRDPRRPSNRWLVVND